MTKLFFLFAALLASPAMAQQSPPPSAVEQALSAKIIKEIQEGVSCSIEKIALQAALNTAQGRIKELESKEK